MFSWKQYVLKKKYWFMFLFFFIDLINTVMEGPNLNLGYYLSTDFQCSSNSILVHWLNVIFFGPLWEVFNALCITTIWDAQLNMLRKTAPDRRPRFKEWLRVIAWLYCLGNESKACLCNKNASKWLSRMTSSVENIHLFWPSPFYSNLFFCCTFRQHWGLKPSCGTLTQN